MSLPARQIVALCWRPARGEQWYTWHTDHEYQYLIRVGWSHRKVFMVWIALNGLLVFWKPQADPGAAAVLAVILAGVWYVVHFVEAKERVTT